ncbi:MAG: hypothetical protein LBS23_01725 [Holosporaceae bacterium]|jgi:hypothetical protein|nr:hypothetical protein [Holosporaceae bacterium]
MYESLKKHCDDFHLYIFAFDDIAYQILSELSFENVTIISLEEFEDAELLKVKPTRTIGEYCWTCTPSTIIYCLKKYNLNHCVYIDADLYFYADPSVLAEEIRGKSVLITSHNYSPEYDQTDTSGKYCVQFIMFKNDPSGIKILNLWREECLNWCLARFEDGKFGDQKYLDDWPERFDCVHVLQNFGGGVAPWNISRYKIDDNLEMLDVYANKKSRLYFYHFEDVKFSDGKLRKNFFCSYHVSKSHLKLIYLRYLICLIRVNSRVCKKNKLIKKYSKENVFRTFLYAYFGLYKELYEEEYDKLSVFQLFKLCLKQWRKSLR